MTIWIRELEPGEFAVLDTLFAGLSPGSRFNRFHAAVPPMRPSVLNAMAAVDGSRHVTVAAYADDELIGIARLITVRDRPADMAVEVVDHWQGCGVGTRLVLAVVDRARTADHTIVEAEIMAESPAVRRLLDRVFPAVATTVTRSEITFGGGLATTRHQEPHAA